MPYGNHGLVFDESLESTELQREYYAYMNQFIRENNIAGISYPDDNAVLDMLDKMTDEISQMMKEFIYVDAGTLAMGDMEGTDGVEIIMEEDPNAPKRRRRSI